MKGLLIFALLHLTGLPGTVEADKYCAGEVEAVVKAIVFGQHLEIHTRDDLITRTHFKTSINCHCEEH